MCAKLARLVCPGRKASDYRGLLHKEWFSKVKRLILERSTVVSVMGKQKVCEIKSLDWRNEIQLDPDAWIGSK